MRNHTSNPLAKSLRHLGLGAAMVAALPLAAQEGGFLGRLSYGLQAGYVIPSGDIGNGFAFGGFTDLALIKSLTLRGRLEYATFNKQNFDVLTVSSNHVGVMVDAVSTLLGETYYPFVGVALYRNSTKVKLFDEPYTNDSGTDFALTVGGGYNFSQTIALEAKYTIADLNMLQVSLLWRF